MASEYVQDLAFRQISAAIMATANTVGSAIAGNDGSSGESSILGVMRRKWEKVQDVIQGIAAPLKRRSMYEELPEQVWTSEHIEMSHIQQRGLGHNFVPCHLTNPTWCDYCGDFIWGLYKQCLRCQTCQYTCHQHCVPAVTLNCKSISEDSVQVKTPSPIEPRSQLETSLSLGNIHARPGCARSVTLTSSQDSIVQQHAKVCSLHAAQTNVPGPTSPHLSRSASEGHTNAQTSDLPCAVSRPTALSSDYASSQSHPHRNINSQSTSNSAAVNTLIVNHHVDICTGDGSGSSTTDHLTEQQVTSQLHGAEGEVNSEEATEKDETDSGYRSGTIPDDKLPRVPSQETLDRQELKRKIAKFNHFVPAACLKVSDKESFQGFLKVTLNLIRPITMELGARPPSIYELLTREHIIEENTQQVAFYMPRDTHKSLHITSDTTTKEVITSLLKKFHILDHPRKFAMYEQEFSDRNKLVRLRRLADKDFPLRAMLTWDPERMKNYRIVLQENETGEIVWDAFSLPELNNFLKVLEREEKETILEMKHKYAYMRQYMERRLTELRGDKNKGKVKK